MAIELYPHNAQTYKKMTAMFEESSRVGVVQPTGTGKSFIILKWMEDHPNEKFIVLSPSLEIFMQFVGYARETGDEALLDNVQMLSYQTLIKMSDEKIRGMHAQKIVVDEFHRTGAFHWGPALLKLLEANLDAKVLGTSATPVRYLDGLRDMASELFDRNLAVEMTLGEAVRRGILPTPKYVPVWYDIDGKMAQYERDISKIKDKEERKELEEKLEQLKKKLENAYGAEEIFKKNLPHNHGKFIVFCRDKEHLEEMKNIVPKWLRGVNKNVRSYVSISAQEDKDIQLWAYVGDNSMDTIKLLFTIDRLNEGLHAKGTDGVIMLRPTVSPIIYLQQMGRALTAGSKSPIIFDFVNNYQNVQVPLDNGETRNVFEFEIRDGTGSNIEIGNFQIFEEMMEFTSLFNAIEDVLYFSNEEIWSRNFEDYVAYKQKFGTEPMKKTVFNGLNLGSWCHNQRRVFMKGVLSAEKIKRLQDAGFIFAPYDETWERDFNAYVAYKKEFGEEPTAVTIYNEINLGNWCTYQRTKFTVGSLSDEKVERLQDAGFVFDMLGASWEKSFEAYVDYKKEFGKEPTQKTVYHGMNLGWWCSHQRKNFKNGNITVEKVARLQDAGFIIDVFGASWEKSFEAYVDYKKEFDKEPTTRILYKGTNLGRWCSSQRQSYKHNKLSDERIQKLRDAGFPFDAKK